MAQGNGRTLVRVSTTHRLEHMFIFRPICAKPSGSTARSTGRLWVPDIRPPYAACVYSWIAPPSRLWM